MNARFRANFAAVTSARRWRSSRFVDGSGPRGLYDQGEDVRVTVVELLSSKVAPGQAR